MTKTIYIVLTLILTYGAFSQSKDCLKYEPEIVEMYGVITQDTFPRHLNHESVKNRNKPEIYWILKLPKSICVDDKWEDDIDVHESNISEMQLELTANQCRRYHKLLGRKVVVTGMLFHSVAPHHKTTILIHVNKMVAA